MFRNSSPATKGSLLRSSKLIFSFTQGVVIGVALPAKLHGVSLSLVLSQQRGES